MMIKSMTAFAVAEEAGDDLKVNVEIKTYNSRYLDIFLKLTKGYQMLEEKVKTLITENLSRGRIDIKINLDDTAEDVFAFEVDEIKAKAYYQALNALKEQLHISGELPLEWILTKDDLIKPKPKEIDIESVWGFLKKVLLKTLRDLNDMRSKEGAYIAEDFKHRLDLIGGHLDQIESQSQGLLELYQERLKNRIAVLAGGDVVLDEGRIEQEAAMIADRSDIAEEITRVRSHLTQFGVIMEADEPSGHKLNFLLQELNREFNTIGSKTRRTEVSHRVVEIKSELEKLREQVQNIE
jgi:uncharacterized protein (TIGR00255 family)